MKANNKKSEQDVWAFRTYEDGYCCFDTRDEAVAEANYAARRDRVQVDVLRPDGSVYATVGGKFPTHEDRCMQPSVWGYED